MPSQKGYVIMRRNSRLIVNVFVVVFACLIFIMMHWDHRPQPLNPIKIGVLYANANEGLFGDEVTVGSALMLAVAEINKEGGLLGRSLECVFVDPGVLNDRRDAFWAEFLVQDEGVDVIFVSDDFLQRKEIRSTVEQNNKILFYPFSYQGLESSDKIICTGSVPNQYLFPCFHWASNAFGEGCRYIMVHSPSAKGRVLYTLAKDVLKIYSNIALESVELPSDPAEVQKAIESILRQRPNVVFEQLDWVREKASFYRTLKERGWNQFYGSVVSLNLSDDEICTIGPEYFDGYYFSRNHFSKSSDTALALLLERFSQKYGPDLALGQAVESAYVSVYLWASAVSRAGTLDPAIVLQNLLQQNHASPLGRHFLDRSNNHVFTHFMIGRLDSTGHFTVVTESEDLIKPEPFPIFRSVEDWRELVERLSPN